MSDAKFRFRLPAYLAVLMSLAMFPLGLISLLQTWSLIDDAEQLARSTVEARTLAAAQRERAVLQQAAGAALALGTAHVSRAESPAQCAQVMRGFVEAEPRFIFAGFIDPGGVMRCSSSGDEMDLSGSANFQRIAETPRLTYMVNREGAVTGASVIIVTQPIYEGEQLKGFMSLSTPHHASLELADPDLVEKGVVIALIGRDGSILAGNRPLDDVADFLPMRDTKALVLARTGQTFSGQSRSGDSRIFAVTRLMEDEIAIVGSWPRGAALAAANPVMTGLTLITPIIMWLAGMGVALWGLHRLVIRHLHALGSALRRFALGERVDGLSLDGASQEFKYLQTAFNRMLVLVREGEAQQERDLEEKTLLLREVHHRVKNNLQLIASIMNMQARTATTPEARRLLAQLQRRVRGLAMVHHTLNAKSRITTVDTQVLVDRLVTELAQRPPVKGQPVEVTKDVISVELGQDQSVTLSMLIAEALTNAVKYVGVPEDGAPLIHVSLETEAPRHLRLSIRNTRGEMDESEDDSALSYSGGIGQKLMQAFASQLEGEAETVEADDMYSYIVTFPIADVVPDAPPAWAGPAPSAAG